MHCGSKVNVLRVPPCSSNAQVVDRAAAAVDAIQAKAGLNCQVVTGGGSGTYRLEAASGVFTEVQPGAMGE